MVEIKRAWQERRDALEKEREKRATEKRTGLVDGYWIEPESITSRINHVNGQLGQKYDEKSKRWAWIKKVLDGPDVCQKCSFDFGSEKLRVEGRSDRLQFFILCFRSISFDLKSFDHGMIL